MAPVSTVRQPFIVSAKTDARALAGAIANEARSRLAAASHTEPIRVEMMGKTATYTAVKAIAMATRYLQTEIDVPIRISFYQASPRVVDGNSEEFTAISFMLHISKGGTPDAMDW